MRIPGFQGLALQGLVLASVLLAGCSTSQQVQLSKRSYHPPVTSVAQSPQDGNSPEMTAHLVEALRDAGLTVKAPLSPGTRTAPDVDAIVSYVDVWRWDVKMYMKSLSVQLFDAKTGDLLVTGQWQDSSMHGFRDAREAMRGVVAEMVETLRGAGATRH